MKVKSFLSTYPWWLHRTLLSITSLLSEIWSFNIPPREFSYARSSSARPRVFHYPGGVASASLADQLLDIKHKEKMWQITGLKLLLKVHFYFLLHGLFSPGALLRMSSFLLLLLPWKIFCILSLICSVNISPWILFCKLYWFQWVYVWSCTKGQCFQRGFYDHSLLAGLYKHKRQCKAKKLSSC